jgi:hypothetical protein
MTKTINNQIKLYKELFEIYQQFCSKKQTVFFKDFIFKKNVIQKIIFITKDNVMKVEYKDIIINFTENLEMDNYQDLIFLLDNNIKITKAFVNKTIDRLNQIQDIFKNR